MQNTDRLIQSDGNVLVVTFGQDGSLTAVCDDAKLRTWNAKSGALQKTVPLGKQDKAPGVFSSDGGVLAIAGPDYAIHMRDVRTGEMRKILKASARVDTMALSPDGKLLAAGGRGRVIRIFDLATGSLKTSATGGVGEAVSLSFSPDSRLLAGSNSDTNVRIWNVASGQMVKLIDELPLSIFALAYSPDGRRLAGAGADRVVYVWDTSTWTNVRKLAGQPEMISSMTFSADGTLLATGGASEFTFGRAAEVRVWDLKNGAVRGHRVTSHAVFSVAFSRDGASVASADGDRVVRVWDL
jgi:WD40 repeat protein